MGLGGTGEKRKEYNTKEGNNYTNNNSSAKQANHSMRWSKHAATARINM